MAVLVVVVDAGELRIGSGHKRRAARVGVRWVGSLGVGVFSSAGGQPRQFRGRMVSDIPVQIGLVHTVDRNQEYVLDLIAARGAGAGGRDHQRRRDG